MKQLDVTGQRFGVLTAVECLGYAPGGTRWLCKCDCGNSRINKIGHLTGGVVKSCGCKMAEATGNRARKHGMVDTATYHVWQGMKGRCYNPRNHKFKDYGARGITVCERWLESFENFLEDMGKKPDRKSIDRENNDLGYFKENCRWATPYQQVHNRRPCKTWRYYSVLGFTGTISQIAKQFRISKAALSTRIYTDGITAEEAVRIGVLVRRK